ncbi:endonuclease/exonuclease/phosphatase family protein [Vibrio sp. ZSDE26]|uniref:Endonuclease/exonuclease/phosphatase family protein n=1 Tax=Vibrio amylolyticus TaxID=2847292 RepID=A0A9X2BJP7_9VIBR|nr:endonuclease/exonuclease/phosphatase family protein [Vibrio amylolyticus]MCK6263632.1 endonuclease/exonuclease/phosphatase family protein [Vibrio amylolyticus]
MFTNHLLKIFVTSLLFVTCSSSANTNLKVMTWNIEWLTSAPNPSMVPSHRSNADFSQLNQYFSQISPDILSFQEVNDLDAIKHVVGSNYTIWLSQRSWEENRKHQFVQTNQYTGFAVNKALSVTRMADLRLEHSPTSKLRFATYIVVEPDSEQPVHMLAIHLKAGCHAAYRNSKNCRRLKQQSYILQQWILDRELDNDLYVIAGDFNHNLSYPNDWMWALLSSGNNAVLASKKAKATCLVKSKREPNKTYQYKSLIDHIVVSDHVLFTDAKQVEFKKEHVLNYNLSDHCPVTLHIQ